MVICVMYSKVFSNRRAKKGILNLKLCLQLFSDAKVVNCDCRVVNARNLLLVVKFGVGNQQQPQVK